MAGVTPWEPKLEAVLATDIESRSAVSGGDINDAWDVRLADGRRVFVKYNAHTPPRMFEAEAAGLKFLREGIHPETNLVVPEVIHVDECFLVLELLERDQSIDQSEELGVGLARLHAASVNEFGAPESNFIGTLGQVNEPRDRWEDFFRDKRLEIQLSLPGARRLLSAETKRRFELLYKNLGELLGPEEPPARLHGDLWGGNAFFTARGPAIFDPAAYAGHREVDLAMMRLFGGFSERTFEAYDEVYPLGPGSDERVKIYQLYPLLVHVNLFGGGYVGSVEDILRRVTWCSLASRSRSWIASANCLERASSFGFFLRVTSTPDSGGQSESGCRPRPSPLSGRSNG
jgi:fructosamine-3-kinase